MSEQSLTDIIANYPKVSAYLDSSCSFSSTHISNYPNYLYEYWANQYDLSSFSNAEIIKVLKKFNPYLYKLLQTYASAFVAGEPSIKLYINNVARYSSNFFSSSVYDITEQNYESYVKELVANIGKLQHSLNKIVLFDTSFIGLDTICECIGKVDRNTNMGDWCHLYAETTLAPLLDFTPEQVSNFYGYMLEQSFVGDGPYLFHCWRFSNPEQAEKIVTRVPAPVSKETVESLFKNTVVNVRTPSVTQQSAPILSTHMMSRDVSNKLSNLQETLANNYQEVLKHIVSLAQYEASKGVRDSYTVFHELVKKAIVDRAFNQLARIHESGPFYIMSMNDAVYAISKKAITLDSEEYDKIFFGHLIVTIPTTFRGINTIRLDGGASRLCKKLNGNAHPHLSSDDFSSVCWGNLHGKMLTSMFGNIPTESNISAFGTNTDKAYVNAVLKTDVTKLGDMADKLSYYLSINDIESLLKSLWILLSSWDSDSPYIDINCIDDYIDEYASEQASENYDEDEEQSEWESHREDIMSDMRSDFNNLSHPEGTRQCYRGYLHYGDSFYMTLMKQPFFKSLDPAYVKYLESSYSNNAETVE